MRGEYFSIFWDFWSFGVRCPVKGRGKGVKGSPVFPTAGNSSFAGPARNEVENLGSQNSLGAGNMGAGGQLPGQASPAGAG